MEAGDTELHKYFEILVEDVSGRELEFRDKDCAVYWHKACYSIFTSKDHIARLGDKDQPKESSLGPSHSKIPRKPFSWKHFCFFCERKTYKKDRNLVNVTTNNFCDTLKKRSNEKDDTKMQSGS